MVAPPLIHICDYNTSPGMLDGDSIILTFTIIMIRALFKLIPRQQE